MKNSILKIRYAIILVMATVVFCKTMAQKFKFNSPRAKSHEYRIGHGFGTDNTFEIENKFILDFENKKWWNERDKTIVNITSDVEITDKKNETSYWFTFNMNEMRFFGVLIVNKEKKGEDVLEYKYDYFPEGSEYPAAGIKFTYSGMATKF